MPKMFIKDKPKLVGDIIKFDFLKPKNRTQEDLANAMGVTRSTVGQLCNNRRRITPETAIMLSRALKTPIDFWLQAQAQVDVWSIQQDPERMDRINRATSLVG